MGTGSVRGAVTLGRQAGQASSCHLTSGARATTGYQMLLFVCLVFLRTARSAPPSPVAWALRRPPARRAHGLCRAHGPYRAHGLLGLLGLLGPERSHTAVTPGWLDQGGMGEQ